MNKLKYLMLFSISIILLFSSCEVYKKINNDFTQRIEKSLKSKYGNVKSVKFESQPANQIDINITTKKKIEKSESDEIYNELRTLLKDKEFEKILLVEHNIDLPTSGVCISFGRTGEKVLYATYFKERDGKKWFYNPDRGENIVDLGE